MNKLILTFLSLILSTNLNSAADCYQMIQKQILLASKPPVIITDECKQERELSKKYLDQKEKINYFGSLPKLIVFIEDTNNLFINLVPNTKSEYEQEPFSYIFIVRQQLSKKDKYLGFFRLNNIIYKIDHEQAKKIFIQSQKNLENDPDAILKANPDLKIMLHKLKSYWFLDYHHLLVPLDCIEKLIIAEYNKPESPKFNLNRSNNELVTASQIFNEFYADANLPVYKDE